MLASAGQGMSVVRLYARRDGGDVREVMRPRLLTQSASCFRKDSGVPDRRCRLFYTAREWLWVKPCRDERLRLRLLAAIAAQPCRSPFPRLAITPA